MRKLVLVLLLVLLLSACGGPPQWKVAGQGEACSVATVTEKDWSDGDRRSFYLLLKTSDGEVGQARVSANQYAALEVGSEVCVIR